MIFKILIIILLVSYLHMIGNVSGKRYVKKNIFQFDPLRLINTSINNMKQFFYVLHDGWDQRKKIKNALNSFMDELSGKSEHTAKVTVDAKMELILESKMSAAELISLHGYKAESHIIFTSDGYILIVHRIIPLLGFPAIRDNKVALLLHGLLGSSDDWLLVGPGKALPYLLSDAGYDVWLVNARGNKYSKAHTSQTPKNAEFWDFSWHEIGTYDLPATIDYIKKITGNGKINLIGHSMGTTAIVAMLSMSTKYNRKLRSVTLLAPLVFMYHAKGPLRDLADYFGSNNYDATSYIKEPEFMKTSTFPKEVIDKYCKGDTKLCLNPLLLLVNGGQDMPDPDTTEIILGHIPAGGSTKSIVHYCQLIKSGQFQMFDYGEKLNYKTYGTLIIPSYNISRITVPVILFSSPDDWLSDVYDVLTLLSQLQNPILHHVLTRDEFSHTDFIWSDDASELIYYLLIDILEQSILHKNMVDIK